MKQSTQKFLLIIGLCCVQMVLLGSLSHDTFTRERNIPQVQSNPPELLGVYDQGNCSWTYTGEISAESDETLFIYSNWSMNAINGTITIKSISGGVLGTYNAISNNSNLINFSVPIKSHPTIENKLNLSITVYNTGGTPFTSQDQTYSTDGSSSPVYHSNTASYQSAIVTLPNTNKAIQIAWTGFSDDNQIMGYTIYRKSASDGILVNNDNRNACTQFNTSVANFTDASIAQDITLTYYYGIIAFDRSYHTSQLYALPKIFGLDNIAPSILKIEYWVNSTATKITWNAGDSTTMTQPICYPTGNLTIHISVSESLRALTANLTSYSNYILSFSAMNTEKTEWEVILNLSKPELADVQMSPGVYSFGISIYDRLDNSQILTLTTFMKVLEPIGKSTEDFPPIDLSVFFIGAGIIIGIAVIGGGFYMLQQKRRVQKVTKEALSDFEVSKGPSKSKKRGQVYSGASAEGRKSAAQAEIMQARRSKNPSSSIPQVTSKTPIVNQSTNSAVSSMEDKTKIASIAGSSQIPEAQTKRDTEIDIDELLSTTPKTSTSSIKMKAAEANIDTMRRMEFLRSKLDALDQNMALMPVILEQTSSFKTQQRQCEKCGQIIDQTWAKCPYCITKWNESQNSSSQQELGENIICPKCKKVIKTGWRNCPYCVTGSK